ncbi:MAG TPA: thioredoxin-like domain-containing protein, partial [Candidatus Acidoferrales bacterium]|nr:thioredoxin-like domain-containing protein [Candidatus Acidoferrales bacterium]
RQQNYQSHLLHVQHVLGLVRATGVADKHITVFSGDGNDPEPDVAVRELQAQRDQWLISGTHVDYALSNQITFVNSALPQLEPQPATKAAIGSWFDDAKKRLHPGDTLLLYVTDHGTRHPEHLDDNFIVLWGKEQLSVSELRALLNGLDPGVRVVMLMSQCFSGSFANLIDVHANDGIPNGNVCGFFSSTAERPAYGCYPENRGRNNVGHSFHFLQALGTTGNFTQSHLQVLVTDASPDVPLRTSDEYLERLLHEASANDDEAYKKLVDELLLEAWKDKGRWEPEIRLLDRIGHAYGTFSPRSLAEIEAQARQLPDIASQMKNSSRAWRGALSDSNEGNLGRFLDANPAWGDRLRPDALKDLTPETRGPLTTSLLHDLRGFTDAHPDVNQKLRTMRRHSREAATTSYRMEVRLGVVLRMRRVLSSIAGRLFVETRGTRQQREAYQALRSCEDLTLPGNNLPTPQLREAKSFPPLERDVTRAQAALPAWMGIQFREPKPETIAESNLAAGAATVVTVYPDSPAAAAGLQPADIITGPPGKPFDEHGEVRSWIMLSKIGEPKKLEVLRDKEHLKMTIVPKLYPLKWPELPGPPKVGSVAPPIDISPYRGTLPTALAGNGSHLLFFWATWCAPCKASLPELLAFERERNVQVVAITDESKERLDPFFQQMKDFPQTVASDEFRKAFVAYGVSGTPTFVLVDDKGAVQAYTTGYDPKKGLGFEGWTWEKQKAGN